MTSRNPFKGIERPSPRSRGVEAVIDPDDYQKVYRAAYPQLKDLLLVLRHTGARPSEVIKATAKNLNPRSRSLVFSEHKTQRKVRVRRPVALDQAAYEAVSRLATEHPEGPLFRTVRGRPWTANRLAQELWKLRNKLKLKGKVTPYGFRHTWATEALSAGHSDATVAAALGHTSTATLHEHYNHLVDKMGRIHEVVDSVTPMAECEISSRSEMDRPEQSSKD
jgi:integrase